MPSEIRATYRVQLHAGFGFVQAAAVADYLANLGISHLYCSPYLHAACGSMHSGDKEVPDPQAFDTFLRSTLDWEERHRKPHASRLDWHRRLLQLRKRVPDLLHGRPDRLRPHFDEQAR
jgi:hypothetical protein